MEFLLLGPVEVRAGARVVAVGGERRRAILAALLLDAGRVVSVEQLVHAAWGDRPPASARVLVRNRVGQLRSALREASPGVDLIVTSGSGYLIQLTEGQLDVDRFVAGVGTADAHAAAGEEALALAGLSEALALWRGPALDGLATPFLQNAANRLEEQRIRAIENRIQLHIDVGRPAEVLPELAALTAAHPYHERLHALHMLALCRAGRQAEALEVYRRVRVVLADELGLDPGPVLQRTHSIVLRADDSPAAVVMREPGDACARPGPVPPPPAGEAAAASPAGCDPQVPRQLPRDVPEFTGRRRELARLDALLTAPADGPVATGTIVVIAGTAGVGKTALAVHWAHRSAGRFPDGQLYVNLCGYAHGAPLRPIDALAQLLRALGLDAQAIPAGVAEAAALLRSRLSGRRVLVLLDNANSAAQVRPLLPGNPDCAVLVTSRDRLTGLAALEGAHSVELEALTSAEAHSLLRRLLGPDRTVGHAAALAQLAKVCAHLPLALRIAAANLTTNPRRAIAHYVAELVAGNHLAALQIAGDEQAAVRASFELSYRAIPPAAQRLFRLLGLVPGPDFTVHSAAALADLSPHHAAGLLDQLATAHLVHQHAPARYTFHDLLRQFAKEQATAGRAESTRAVERLFDWYVKGADQAAARLYPDFLRYPCSACADSTSERFVAATDALEWLHTEQANLVAACVAAAETGPRPVAWLLASALRGYLAHHYGSRIDHLMLANAGLAAAVADGDERAQALMNLSIAREHHVVGHHEKAVGCLELALTLSRRSGWRDGEGRALIDIGIHHAETGRLKAAEEHFIRARELARAGDSPMGVAGALTNLGTLYRLRGRLRQAAATLSEAISILRQSGDHNVVMPLYNLGAVARQLGFLKDAAHNLEEALAKCGGSGHRAATIGILVHLCATHLDAGQAREGLQQAQDAVRLAKELGLRHKHVDALNGLGHARRAAGDDAGLDCHQQALRLACEMEYLPQAAEALIGLAQAQADLGRHREALDHAHTAIELAGRGPFSVLEGRAHTVRATVHLMAGAADQAIAAARRALGSHRQTGHRLGQARTLVLLGEASRRVAGLEAARRSWHAALDLFVDIDIPHDAAMVRALLDDGDTSQLKWTLWT